LTDLLYEINTALQVDTHARARAHARTHTVHL